MVRVDPWTGWSDDWWPVGNHLVILSLIGKNWRRIAG